MLFSKRISISIAFVRLTTATPISGTYPTAHVDSATISATTSEIDHLVKSVPLIHGDTLEFNRVPNGDFDDAVCKLYCIAMQSQCEAVRPVYDLTYTVAF